MLPDFSGIKRRERFNGNDTTSPEGTISQEARCARAYKACRAYLAYLLKQLSGPDGNESYAGHRSS